MSGKLYVVGTPIGNLSDFSPRAIETLESVDFIAAEDTRVTAKLLNRFEIKKPMISYFEHNRREKGQLIVDRIIAGENCAIVTDAGMPAISDPGEDLVDLCHENGIVVVSVPGPTAFATALAISGMNTGRFTFEGFLSMNRRSGREHLESIEHEKRTMVFYEAPHKLSNTLKDLFGTLGDRKIAIIRELTKIHEEVIRTTLGKACELYGDSQIKGEIVLVIDGEKEEKAEETTLADAVKIALNMIENGMSVNEAAKETAKMTKFKKNEIYKEVLKND